VTSSAGSPTGKARGRLSSREAALGADYDLLAAYGSPSQSFAMERDGIGVAGVGGPTIPVSPGPDLIGRAAEAAGAALDAIARAPGGAGTVVAGALPFEERSPALLSVLTSAVRRASPGRTTRVEVISERGAPAGTPQAARRPRPGSPAAAFDAARLRSDPSPAAYGEAVERAAGRIAAGELRKVVLARSLVVDAGRELDERTLLWRLRAVDPACFAFAAPTTRGIMVGASPELLVSRSGTEVRANPLAGSAPRFGDPAEDRAAAERLRKSAKDREEHAIVADAVAAALGPFTDELTYPADPELLGTANVWHLSTPFRGRLRQPAPNVLRLVAALHPTPAICGAPRDAARRAIAELETFERGCYAGPVGWMDAEGDGEWAIALRCAELMGRRARLFSGAGIVAGSDPDGEIEETDRKFRALLDALRWS
jgi:isochorismate synthase